MLNINHHNKKDSSFHGSQLSNAGSQSGKKWSFGRLFRKKKENDSESTSEDDRKAGFIPATQKYSRGSNKTKSKSKSHRNSKTMDGSGFDHIVVPKSHSMANQHIDNEFFLPVETISPPPPPVPSKTYQEPYYQNQQYLQPAQLPPPPQQQQLQQQQHFYQNQEQPPQALYTRSTNSLDRRGDLRPNHKSRSSQRLQNPNVSGIPSGLHSSSEEELISLNSSTFSKFRSDESIHSGGLALAQAAGAQSRRSRAARNERYYKRLSRDGEQSHGQVPAFVNNQTNQRWKTQPVPLSIYNGSPSGRPSNSMNHLRTPSNTTTANVNNSDSLSRGTTQSGYVQWAQLQRQQPQKISNTVNENKRSISYDSHIHLQNINGRIQSKPLPPPPPPRDPLRRVHMGNHVANYGSGDLRPMSYAFDQTGVPVLAPSGLTNRCVSDDRIWANQVPHYQSAHSLNTQPVGLKETHQQQPQQPQQQQSHPPQTPQNKRFITRAERDAHPSKKSLPNGLDFHYIADATPRSRKPIHMLDQEFKKEMNEPPPSSGILRTSRSGLPDTSTPEKASEFYRRLDEGSSSMRRGRNLERQPAAETLAKPRSISSSRISDLRSYPIPMYSEINKNHRKPLILSQEGADEVDNIICGSLHIKPSNEDLNNSYVEIRHKDGNKSNSMPNHYQRSSGSQMSIPNKYEEYVAEKKEKHHKPLFNPPTPPQRVKPLVMDQGPPPPPPVYFPRKKPTNLEEAINELEAIYRSLGLTEEPEKKERVPTPSEFEKFALAHADSYDDDDSPAGEPDPVKDDVAFRSIQLANLQHKANEKQPPFGIPIGPIVAAPKSDYLHVKPIEQKKEKKEKKARSPDIITDDLAVRALRKDPPQPKEKFVYPMNALQKKNRATRTQSANIYSLIQRDAAKPSGGDLSSFMELTRNIDRAGSMSDIHKTETTNDIPSTLALLRHLKEQDEQQQKLEEQQMEERIKKLAAEQAAASAASSAVSKKAHIPFRHPSQGGAICQLPERLTSPKGESTKTPVPMPRKSLTPEPLAEPKDHKNRSPSLSQMDEALNKIVQEAQESSLKLTRELQELRRQEVLSSSSVKPAAIKCEEEARLVKDLKEIEAVSEAAKRCGKMLLENLPDANEKTSPNESKSRKLHKEDKLIEAIDQVSEAANAVCEKILKDIVTTEPPVVVQQAVKVQNPPEPVAEDLVMPKLLKKLDVIQSDRIEAIAKRCMRQLSELADQPDYDNLNGNVASTSACNEAPQTKNEAQNKPESNLISSVSEIKPNLKQSSKTKEGSAELKRRPQELEEIDKIMQECEAQAKAEVKVKSDAKEVPGANAMTGSGTGSSNSSAGVPVTFSSSSDCLAKSSSPSAGRRLSSSITSFNPYSSSDYLKSPSSEYHAPSTDPIKTFSTTSYDVESTSATPNITTNSTFSFTPSPPLNLTPVSGHSGSNKALHPCDELRARSSSPSQYNSSEELAMIFGIEERPKHKPSSYHQHLQNKHQQYLQQQQQQQHQQHQKQQSETALSNSGNVKEPKDKNHETSTSKSSSCASQTQTASASASLVVTTTFNCVTKPANQDPAPVFATTFTATTTTSATKETNHASSNLATNHTNNSFNQPSEDLSNPPYPLNHFDLSPSCSNYSYKLETIPELDDNSNDLLKLSPNFNKIYNSEISIVVDKTSDSPVELNDPDLNHHRHHHLNVNLHDSTQLDSLSSLEETSSNPDSGNVSLSDFPMNSGHANASLQLQTPFNSRFEIRTSFINEVSIETEAEESPSPSQSRSRSLVSELEEEDEEKNEENSDENEIESNLSDDLSHPLEFEELSSCKPEILKALKSEKHQKIENEEETDSFENLPKQAKQNGFALEQKAFTEKPKVLSVKQKALNFEQKLTANNEQEAFNEKQKAFQPKQKALQSKQNLLQNSEEAKQPSMSSEPKQISKNNEEKTEEFESKKRKISLNSIVDFSELDLSDLELSEQELSILEDLQLDDAVENPNFALIQRSNIIIETPRLNMNISEVKIKNDEESDEVLEETVTEKPKKSKDNFKENRTPSKEKVSSKVGSENPSKKEGFDTDSEEASSSKPQVLDSQESDPHREASQQSLIPWLPFSFSSLDDEAEKPSTSAKASTTTLSIYGEVRPTNTLTTLEHILVASTLGFLSPNDLFTLFIVILGMMIIIAIALC